MPQDTPSVWYVQGGGCDLSQESASALLHGDINALASSRTTVGETLDQSHSLELNSCNNSYMVSETPFGAMYNNWRSEWQCFHKNNKDCVYFMLRWNLLGYRFGKTDG